MINTLLFLPNIFNTLTIKTCLLIISLLSCVTHASYESDNVDEQKYLVGTYSGTLDYKTPQPIELALWFGIKGSKYENSSVSGTMVIGENKGQCFFKLRRENFYHKGSGWDYPPEIKKSHKNLQHPVVVAFVAEPVLNNPHCFAYGILKRRKSVTFTLSLKGGDNKRFDIDFKKRDNRSGKAKLFTAKVSRNEASSAMQTLWQSANQLKMEAPNTTELVMLNSSRQVLTADIASSMIAKSCTDLFLETKATLDTHGIDNIVTFTNEDNLYLRLSKKNSQQYIQQQITNEDKVLLSSDQWQALTLIDGVNYADDLACAFTDAHKIASSYSLIDKYSNLPSNAINPSWVISKNKDIFIVEATGIDVIRAKRSMYNENKVNRLYGVTGIFLPGDHTRSFNWYEKLQKANTVSYYKDAGSGNTFSYKDEIVEVFFTPAENAIERFGYPALTIEAKKNAKKQVCARWLGEQTTHVCSKTINTVKANQLFITQHEEAALAIFKELAPKAVLEATKESVLAYNKQCLTKAYCNFPAASFITAIYNNNYTDFTAQNESFTQNMLERYKNHLLVTNVLLQKMGFETPKKNTLNLFPYFAEYYLHLFDKKYPNCNRAQQTLSIRSDTQAYNIVDQDDNVIERHDSVALYSDYKIPITMVPMCNQICGQTGPSRTLSDFSNMMAHPSMVKILDGVHKTMDTFSCDSPEILTLEAGILGIFKSLKEKSSQKAFQERSSLL